MKYIYEKEFIPELRELANRVLATSSNPIMREEANKFLKETRELSPCNS